MIAIQVFSLTGDNIGAFSSDILGGLEHVLGLAPFYDIAVANLSLARTGYANTRDCDADSPAQYDAVELLRASGIITVSAAGNNGFSNQISSPACLSNVVSVGSTSDDDVVSGYSNHADFLSLLAPGESIETASRGGGKTTAGGTSMAAPHVAGAIAVIREAHPEASVAEIENALTLTGTPVLEGNSGITTPRLDVHRAIEFISASEPEPEPEPEPTAPPRPPVAPPPAAGMESPDVSASSSRGGGASCGLVGIEPFLMLGGLRLGRRLRRAGWPMERAA